MLKIIQKTVSLKSLGLLRVITCVGALSLIFISNASAIGGSTTPIPPPPCGGWNTVGKVTFPPSSFSPNYAVVVYRLPKNKLTALSGASVKLMQNGKEVQVGTTLSQGQFLFSLFSTGTFDLSIKMPGHRFNSRESKIREGMQADTIYMDLCQ